MTIASDFYAWLDNDHRSPGTEGRKLHNRIAELEEVLATLRSGFRTLVEEEALLSFKYADLQREHARVKAEVVLWKAEAAAHTGGAVSLDEIRRAYEATK